MNQPAITVRNVQRALPVELSRLREAAMKALAEVLAIPRRQQTTLQRLDEVSVLLVSDRRIAALHRQFMNQPGATDVITFEHGEIFVSTETARRNARRFGSKFPRELELYVVHGLLHLHGFDDRTPAGARRMQRTQEKLLRRMTR